KDGVAGVAIVGFDGPAILGLVVAVVTTETAGPDHVAEVVRINAPIGLHLWEKIVTVNLLHHRNHVADARIMGIPLRQRSGDAVARLGAGAVFAGEDIDRVGFDPRDGAVNLPELHGEVDGLVRRNVTMRRTVVAVHAIHFADFKPGDVVGELRGAINRNDTLLVGDPYPGDLLPGHIRCNVFHLVPHDHVPVDAADRAAGRVGAPDFDREPDGIRRVGCVALKIIERAVEIAAEFLRPVTLFAGFARRTQVFDGRGDGPRIFVEDDGIDLIGTGEF